MPQPDDLCVCRSGATFGECHGLLFREHYEANPPLQLRYRVPPHARGLNLANLANQISALSPYNVSLQETPSRLVFELRHPLKWLSSWPVLRTPETIGIYYDDPPLDEVKHWPKLDIADAPVRMEAFTRLGGRRDVSLQWLRQFQDDLTALTVRNDAVSMKTALRHLLPLLRRQFPMASIDCFMRLATPLSGTRLPITLAQLELLPVDEIIRRAESRDKVGGHHYLMLDPEPYFTVLANLSYPFVSGFTIGHPEFLLHIDYGELPLLASAATEERSARNVHSVLLAEALSPHDRADIVTSSNARINLRNWLCRALDRFFSQLAHPGTFASHEGNIHPRQQAEDLATVASIMEITNLLLTESHPAVIRLLFFDVVDRYCALGRCTTSEILSERFFSQIAENLDPLLGKSRQQIYDFTLSSWRELVELLWQGQYDPSARASTTVTITPPGGASLPSMSHEEFASAVLKALRDTTHGHGLDQELARNLLVRHSGLLPSKVRKLAISLWFGLLSNPQQFWGKRARFDSVHPVVIADPESK